VTAARRYRVAVVGFGIAGAATAILLARSGHAVTLLERATHVGPIGAGLLLQPAGQAVLRRMGLLDAVVAGAAPIEELYVVRKDRGTLLRLSYREFDQQCCAYGVHRGTLFNVLARAVHSEKIDVRLGCEVAKLAEQQGSAYLIDCHDAEHGPFDVVVAADGSRSTLRSLARLPHRVLAYDHGAFWITGACTSVRDKLYQVCRGTRNLLGILPIGNGSCSLYWGMPCRELDSARARGLDALKSEIVSFCPESRELVEPLTDMRELLFTTYRHVWMRRWHTRHVVVIGDAAHATSPHLGQGGSLALLDAWALAGCLDRLTDLPSAFRAYAHARAAHIRYYNSLTFLLSPFFQGDGRLKGLWRDFALPIMPRLPWVRRQMLMTMCGLKGGWLRGRLTI